MFLARWLLSLKNRRQNRSQTSRRRGHPLSFRASKDLGQAVELLEDRVLLTQWGGDDGWMDFPTWNQGASSSWQSNWNQFCPTGEPNDTSTRAVVGCVATAEAQVAWYWDYPEQIRFTAGFTAAGDSYVSRSSNGTDPPDSDIFAVDGDAAAWSFSNFAALGNEMATIDYSDDSNMREKALLSLAVGFKAQMNYSEHGSGAWVTDTTFRRLGFGSADMVSDGSPRTEAWDATTRATVIDNLKSGAPVVLAVRGTQTLADGATGRPGHAVVLEGYDDVEDEFLINLGWGGAHDGWYSLPDFTTGSIAWDNVETVVYNIFPDQGWNQEGSDAQNTKRSPYAIPLEAKERWHYRSTGNGTIRGIVVGTGGNVYAIRDQSEPSVRVIDPSGTLVDTIALPGGVNGGIDYPAQSSNGDVFFPTDFGEVWKVDGHTQSVTKVFQEPSSEELLELKIDEEGILYVRSWNTLYALSPDGTVLWDWATPGTEGTAGMPRSPAVDDVRGRVYVPYYFRPGDGRTLSRLAVLDRSNGNLLYTEEFGDRGLASKSAGSPSVGSDGTVYVGDNKWLRAFNPDATLTEKWNKEHSSNMTNAPAINANGTLYVPYYTNDDNYVIAALDPQNGNEKWTIPFSASYLGQYGYGREVHVGANDVIAFVIHRQDDLESETDEVHVYRDLGDSREQLWMKDVGDLAPGLAVGPGNTLYIFGGKQITALGSGEVGDPRGGGMGYENNSPPAYASDPGVPVGSVVDGDTVTLSWTDSDPDGHSLSYTVLLGEVNGETTLMAPVATGLTETSFELAGLRAGTAYLWKVVSTDGQAETEGPTWTFSTAESDGTEPGDVHIEGNAMWNNQVYISWQNISHVYQPSTNMVIDTWKVDDDGDGDPRNDNNRIMRPTSLYATGISVSMGSLSGTSGGANASTFQNGDGSVTLTLSAASGQGTIQAQYTVKPDDPNIYARLELAAQVDAAFHWGILQFAESFGNLEQYEKVVVDGDAHPTSEDQGNGTYHWSVTTAQPDYVVLTSTQNQWTTGMILEDTPIPLELAGTLMWYQSNYGHHVIVSTPDGQLLSAGNTYNVAAIFHADRDLSLSGFEQLTAGAGPDTVGLYVPGSSWFLLNNSNSMKNADIVFGYGIGGLGWEPIVGDWDGDGTDTVGLYVPGSSTFLLNNSNSMKNADLVFGYGPGGLGWEPIVGDWDGNGTDTVGLYVPGSSWFLLNNSNSTRNADLVFGYGPGGLGWEPIVGDWDGDGRDTVGLYAPGSSTFFLNNSNSTRNADIVFGYGPGGLGWKPIVGDWDGNGTDTVGLYAPGSSTFFLNDSNSTRNADVVFGYGAGGLGWEPIVGDWDGGSAIQLSSAAVLPEPAMEDLGEADLQPVIETAIGLWAEAGIRQNELDRLGQISISSADLSGSSLAVTSSFGIRVDVDAAGHGWFVDATPHQNEEFLLDTENGNLRAVGSVASQVDLLTVLVHEFGHVLGLQHDSEGSVMNGLLPLGVRRLPSVDLIDAVFSSEPDDELFL